MQERNSEQKLDRGGFIKTASLVAGALFLPCRTKSIKLPKNAVITLTEPYMISGLRNCMIDFNGCVFVLSDNYSPAGKPAAVIVQNCDNVTLKNLTIEGNKENNIDNHTFGLIITKSQRVTVRDLKVSNINYHGIWVRAETPGTKFFDLILENNYGLLTSSDVYVDNLPTDSVEFVRVTVTRDEGMGQQVFYFNGYNSTIDGLTASNIYNVVIDYRHGHNVLKNLRADNCSTLFVVKRDANVIASDVVGTNCNPGKAVSAIRIQSCESVAIKNTTIDGLNYGLRIDSGDGGVIQNVKVTDFKSNGAKTAAIRLANIDNSCVLENIELSPQDMGYTLYLKGCTAPQYVNGLTEIEPNRGIYDPDGMLVKL